MTENQREVLRSLYLLRDRDQGVTPMNFGGSDGSHHSATASRLADKGLVDKCYAGQGWGEPRSNYFRARGSCFYRISETGIRALETNEAQRLDPESPPSQHSERTT